jgi:hypothetical protein
LGKCSCSISHWAQVANPVPIEQLIGEVQLLNGGDG